ncbi:RagB/SusD family nutrient uptake outer membrane protein [Puia sp. P3]|uniref:RagB/SusD family nutrient uptake outer membrane protein n=1 Tax=Puia sp. P3 TaxID=3423952 RepID=UPI003D67B2D3
MKHIRNSILILTTLGVLTEACTKDRNVFPSDAYTDGNLIRDEQTAKTVLNGVYYRFAYAGTNSSGVRETQWTAVNEYFPSELAGSLVPIFTTDDSIFNFTFTPSFPLIDTIWDYCYNMINAASGFIKNAAPVNNIPAASKRQMLSEARFLRAFARTELLFYFAQYRDPSSKYGIILRDTFVTVGTLNEPRSSVAEAYASILADLDAAIDGLPVKNTDIYYANAASAKLLKARVLINRGIPGDYSR